MHILKAGEQMDRDQTAVIEHVYSIASRLATDRALSVVDCIDYVLSNEHIQMTAEHILLIRNRICDDRIEAIFKDEDM